MSSEDEGVSEAMGSMPSRPESSELVARRAKVRLMDSMAESSRRDSWLMSEPLADIGAMSGPAKTQRKQKSQLSVDTLLILFVA